MNKNKKDMREICSHHVVFLMLNMMFSAGLVFSQKPSGYFGKRVYLGVEKNFNWGALSPDKSFTQNKAKVYPCFTLYKITSPSSVIGFSFGVAKYTVINNGKDFDFVVPYKDKYLYIPEGYGTIHVNSNAFKFHKKKYYQNHSMAPVGIYRSIDLGYIKSNVVFDEKFELKDLDGISYAFSTPFKMKFNQLFIGVNLGKTFSIWKRRALFDVSFGPSVMINLTHSSNRGYDGVLVKTSRFAMLNQIVKIKTGFYYAF